MTRGGRRGRDRRRHAPATGAPPRGAPEWPGYPEVERLRSWRTAMLAALLSLAFAHAAAPAGLAPGDARPAETVEVRLEVVVPETTPADASVFVAGDFQGWRPGEEDWRLAREGSGVYAITLPLERGARVRYKLTLGSWERVEKGPDGEEIPDRELVADRAKTVRVTVASWRDPSREPAHTIVGRVETFSLERFQGGRRVWVYLPPGYDEEPERRYPVLYLLDGQNVFDAATSFSGEWRADETLEREIPAGRVAPLLVVAIDNAGAGRMREYTPWDERPGGRRGGGAGEFLDALLGVLKPEVDRRWRTLTDPEHTAIGGSSLGGLFAAWALAERPDAFGSAAVFSPALGWGPGRLAERVARARLAGRRVWLDVGTAEGPPAREGEAEPPLVRAVRDLAAAFRRAGVRERDLALTIAPGARHHESAWAARLPDALAFLFPAPAAPKPRSNGSGASERQSPPRR